MGGLIVPVAAGRLQLGKFNWGPDGPPAEAYSRVTEPERFLPLIDWTLDLLSRLEAEYDVVREENCGIDPELERMAVTKPTVRLTPKRDGAAPITAAFTHYEHAGVHVRFGRFRVEPFPDCGCDACDETAEENFELLQEMVEAVVAGQFKEWFRLQPDGSGTLGYEFWSSESHPGYHKGWKTIRPGTAPRFSEGKDWFVEWEPWTLRTPES